MASTPNITPQSNNNASFAIVTQSNDRKGRHEEDILLSTIVNVAQQQVTTNADKEEIIKDDDDDDDPMIYYHDSSIAHQTPERSPSKILPVPTPIVYSPNLHAVKLLTKLDTSQVEKRNRAAEHVKKVHKKRQTLYSPKESILLFLREKHFEAEQGSFLHSNNHFKRAYMKFSQRGERHGGITWKPFLELKNKLTDAPCPLSIFHQRLIIEDFMLLEPGESIICLLSSGHYFLNSTVQFGSKQLSNRWVSTIKRALAVSPHKPVVLSGVTYFPFQIRVHSNPSVRDFVDRNMIKSEIEHLCTYEGGGGINCDIVVGEQGETCRELFKFYDLIYCYDSIQFWKVQLSSQIPKIKDCLIKFKDIPSLGPRVIHFLKEFEGDSASTLALVQYYELRVKDIEAEAKITLYKTSAISTNKLIANFRLAEDDKRFTDFRDYVDDLTRNAVMNLYGKFVEFTSPLLSQTQLDTIANKFKLALTPYYELITVLLNKMSPVDSSKIVDWDRFAFYIFCILMRIRNNHNFSWWALCNTASTYHQSGQSLTVYFGLSLSRTTMRRKLQALCPYADVMDKTNKMLRSSGPFAIAIFDNSQIIRPLKYQRDGHSSSTTITTSRCFVRPVIPDNLSSLIFVQEKCTLTFVNQCIPSPPGMLCYENLEVTDAKAFKCRTQSMEEGRLQDTSGSRVTSYCNLLRVAATVSKFRRIIPRKKENPFLYHHDKYVSSMNKLDVQKKLLPNATNHESHDNSCFYTFMASFQHRATTLWRGTVPRVALVIPPIHPEDETTNIGAAKVVLSLLSLYGILVLTNSEGASGDPRGMKLADDYNSRYLMVIGDGLSQLRMRTFSKLIEDNCFRMDRKSEATVMIQKALGQIIHIPGDLHGGCFHFLSAIYNIFYGALLQPIQSLLGWKRIKGTDVTKCYQQAAGLAMMVACEIDRQLISFYFHSLYENMADRLRFQEEDKADELAIQVATGFIHWRSEKRRSTTDQYLKMIISFVTLTDMYILFRQSLRAGDSIAIEWLYNEFLPVLLCTGKVHCLESILSSMEHLYSDLEGRLLHLVRLNRTHPLYNGCDNKGNPMAHWSLDGIIELIQKYYHQMNFDNSEEGWITNSPHIMLMNKARRFSEEEYKRSNSTSNSCESETLEVEKSSTSKSPNLKASIIPNRAREHHAIAEYLNLLGVVKEVPDRQYSKVVMWKMLGQITTILDDKSQDDINKTLMEELSLTEEEKLLNDIADEIFQEGMGDSVITLGTNVECNEEEQDDEDGEDVENGNDNLQNIRDDVADETEVDISIGNTRKHKVRRAKVNHLAFIDIVEHGRELLVKKNLPLVRTRKKQRLAEELDLREAVFNSVFTGNDSSTMPSWLQDAFEWLET